MPVPSSSETPVLPAHPSTWFESLTETWRRLRARGLTDEQVWLAMEPLYVMLAR